MKTSMGIINTEFRIMFISEGGGEERSQRRTERASFVFAVLLLKLDRVHRNSLSCSPYGIIHYFMFQESLIILCVSEDLQKKKTKQNSLTLLVGI